MFGVDWAIIASASYFASGILQKVGEGYLGGQGDRKICQVIDNIANKLKRQTPAENHELAKAFRRAGIVAMQNICDSRRTTETGSSNFVTRHIISESILGDTPKSVSAEDESQWHEKANEYLKKQIERLNQNSDFLPDGEMETYRYVVNPQDEQNEIWAKKVQEKLTEDMISELIENVGEPSTSIKYEIENRWFFQTSNEFQNALARNDFLANKFQNNMLGVLGVGQEQIFEFLQMMFANVKISLKDSPDLVGSLIERSLFVNRETEKGNLEKWLTEKSKKIIVIEGISGYGKTSLLMEVLHEISPDGKTLGEKINAVLVFLCREGEGNFREVCKKADERLGKNQDSYVQRYENFRENRRDKPEEIPVEIIGDIIGELKALGNVWMIFDNFETVLENQSVNEPYLQAFFEKALQFDGVNFLLTSQKVPEFEAKADVEAIGIGILPDKDALKFFRKEGQRLKENHKMPIDCGLAEITSDDLEKLKDLNFAFVPQALVALVGYFEKSYRKEGTTLAEVLQDETLFAKFREHDAKEGAMYLIGKQYEKSSANERLILKALSIFPQAIEYPALENILKEQIDDDTLFSILIGNSLIRGIQPNLYELLPQAKEAISKQTDREDESLTRQKLHLKAAEFYNKIRQPIAECYTQKQFEPYFNAIDHSIKAENYDAVVYALNGAVLKLNKLGFMQEIISRCEQVVGKLSTKEFEANNYVILGLSLWSFGKFDDAITEYEKAIEILKLLVESGREELASGLAMAYMNKGISLYSLENLTRAITEYGKAIEILKPLVESGHRELADNLAAAYVNRGVSLYSLWNLTEAIAEFEKAIEILKPLMESGRKELASDLAMAYLNKGNAIRIQGNLKEAIAEYEKAIEILKPLVKSGRKELASDLAMAYVNRGVSLNGLGNLTEAIVENDKAIEIFKPLVESGRKELADNLAAAYLSKGTSLDDLGNLEEAITEYEKAIEIFKPLVESGRKKLANDLAATYLNKGVSLNGFGNLEDAIAEYEKAIEILKPLVDSGHKKVADDLAKTYMNKGISLANLGNLTEAIAAYDSAIEIRKLLVDSGHKEISNELAKTYVNKGVSLYILGNLTEEIEFFSNAAILWTEAIEIFGDAVSLWEYSIQRGEIQNLLDLIKTFQMRIGALRKIEDWETTGLDVGKAFRFGLPVLERDDFPEHFKQLIGQEIVWIIGHLCEVSPENREKIYKNADEMGDVIRQYVDSRKI